MWKRLWLGCVRPCGLRPIRPFCSWDSHARYPSLGILPTQASNPGLSYCRTFLLSETPGKRPESPRGLGNWGARRGGSSGTPLKLYKLWTCVSHIFLGTVSRTSLANFHGNGDYLKVNNLKLQSRPCWVNMGCKARPIWMVISSFFWLSN